MYDNVLYFPYIRVPKSPWFVRTLLYWDTVGAIIPYDFIEDPDRLDPYTQELLQANLVEIVQPGAYLWKIPNFAKAFLDYLESLGDELEERKKRFRNKENIFTIHAEKMFELTEPLEEMGLIVPHDHYPWYEVESDTGRDFMSYLAATLGKVEDLQRSPITDQPNFLTEFMKAGISISEGEDRLSNLREGLLEDLLPSPNKIIKPAELEKFKNRHGALLKGFRRTLERELITIADMVDEGLRSYRLQIFREENAETLKEITSIMKGSGWIDLIFGKFSGLISRIPGVPPQFGLASAVYNAFKPGNKDVDNSPLLYAAYAQKELLG
jgi:hypothetical protein